MLHVSQYFNPGIKALLDVVKIRTVVSDSIGFLMLVKFDALTLKSPCSADKACIYSFKFCDIT